MALLSQAKTLGGIGSLLILLTLVPSVGWLLGLAGFIMLLIAVRYISVAVGDASIFNNMIISIIASILGVVIAGISIVATLFSIFGVNWRNPDFFPNLGPGSVPSGDIIAIIVSVLLALVIVWITLMISAFFLRRSYNAIGTKLKVGMFKTTALLYLIGSATSIIIIGFVIIFVAEILQIVSFFSMPDQLPQPSDV